MNVYRSQNLGFIGGDGVKFQFHHVHKMFKFVVAKISDPFSLVLPSTS